MQNTVCMRSSHQDRIVKAKTSQVTNLKIIFSLRIVRAGIALTANRTLLGGLKCPLKRSFKCYQGICPPGDSIYQKFLSVLTPYVTATY